MSMLLSYHEYISKAQGLGISEEELEKRLFDLIKEKKSYTRAMEALSKELKGIEVELLLIHENEKENVE